MQPRYSGAPSQAIGVDDAPSGQDAGATDRVRVADYPRLRSVTLTCSRKELPASSGLSLSLGPIRLAHNQY